MGDEPDAQDALRFPRVDFWQVHLSRQISRDLINHIEVTYHIENMNPVMLSNNNQAQ